METERNLRALNADDATMAIIAIREVLEIPILCIDGIQMTGC